MKTYLLKKKMGKILFAFALAFLALGLFKENYGLSGFCSGLIFVFIFLTLKYKRLEKNEEKFNDLINSYEDERIIYIANSARSLTLAISIFALAIICFVFELMGKQDLASVFAIPIGIITIIYLISYYYFSKKY